MSKISIILPNLKFGGAEKLHLNLVKSWSEKGFDVEFILMQRTGEYLHLVPKEIKVISFEVLRLNKIIFPLIKYLKKSNPDYILAAMWPLTSYSIISWLLSGRIGKIFVSDHVLLSISAIYEIKVPLFYLKTLIRFTYKFSTGVIAVSNGVRKDLINIGNLDHDKVRVIHNPAAIGINVKPVSKNTQIELWGGDYTYKILTVARLKEEKDHETLIYAFSLLPSSLNVKLIILGDGHLKGYLEDLIKKINLQDKIELVGFVEDPYPWYCSADLFVLSSKWEGFGNVIVEAMECGTTVVSTDCPSGPREILCEGKYGRLVPVGDRNLLSFAMYESLKNPCNSELLKSRARDFSISAISKKYLDYFDS